MKRVIFCRHAKSSWDNPEWTDRSRPLNERGLRDAPIMAAHLKANAAQPDCILVSPANRTQETAAFYAQAFALPDNALITEAQIYEAYPKTIWEIIQSLDNQYNTVLLVGHNPAMSYLLNDCGTAEYYADLPTCGVFQTRFEVDDWQAAMPQTAFLEHLWYPKML